MEETATLSASLEMMTLVIIHVAQMEKKFVSMDGKRTIRISHVMITVSNPNVPLDVARPMVTALSLENANVMKAGRDIFVTNAKSTLDVFTEHVLSPGPVTAKRVGVVRCVTRI